MGKAGVLVSIQLLCMAGLVYLLPLYPVHWLQGLGMAAGLLPGIWALLSMHWNTIRVSPVPAEQGKLTQSGPYRYIRHPMYTSVLVFFGVWVFSRPSLLAMAVFGLLILNLLVKLHYEEKLLSDKYPEYQAYSERTYRLIPGVY